MIKKILLAPRFSKDNQIIRSSSTNTLSDFLLDQDFLPIMSFYDTKFSHKEEAIGLAKKYLEISDALILQGGNDISPSFYNQNNTQSVDITKFRDVFELALTEVAVQKNIPVLGICRGMQILNIFFGGDLNQHLEEDKYSKHIDFLEVDGVKIPDHSKMHAVDLTPDFNLASWTKKTKLFVNSEHHQGIRKLGVGLELEAKSPDGLVEAFSKNSGQILGIQWHPELDLADPDQVRILNGWLGFV